eukprot:686631-Prymnesium_polylepis.1
MGGATRGEPRLLCGCCGMCVSPSRGRVWPARRARTGDGALVDPTPLKALPSGGFFVVDPKVAYDDRMALVSTSDLLIDAYPH